MGTCCEKVDSNQAPPSHLPEKKTKGPKSTVDDDSTKFTPNLSTIEVNEAFEN